MKEELISFETAKLAKEKGLESSKGYYYDKNGKIYGMLEPLYYAPTQSLLQKWLREKYTIHVQITWDTVSYEAYIFHPDWPEKDCARRDMFNSYEEALEAGLQVALKSIK